MGLAVMIDRSVASNIKALAFLTAYCLSWLAVPNLHLAPLITTCKVERRHCQDTTYTGIPTSFGDGLGRKVKRISFAPTKHHLPTVFASWQLLMSEYGLSRAQEKETWKP